MTPTRLDLIAVLPSALATADEGRPSADNWDGYVERLADAIRAALAADTAPPAVIAEPVTADHPMNADIEVEYYQQRGFGPGGIRADG